MAAVNLAYRISPPPHSLTDESWMALPRPAPPDTIAHSPANSTTMHPSTSTSPLPCSLVTPQLGPRQHFYHQTCSATPLPVRERVGDDSFSPPSPTSLSLENESSGWSFCSAAPPPFRGRVRGNKFCATLDLMLDKGFTRAGIDKTDNLEEAAQTGFADVCWVAEKSSLLDLPMDMTISAVLNDVASKPTATDSHPDIPPLAYLLSPTPG
ncbi:hypothetical protein BD779DRAFT_1482872 [Infundibulicybe gibba]|nr:hypothetical protein BD779DRAFT_1482872 [Infundibulicybe gibba]